MPGMDDDDDDNAAELDHQEAEADGQTPSGKKTRHAEDDDNDATQKRIKSSTGILIILLGFSILVVADSFRIKGVLDGVTSASETNAEAISSAIRSLAEVSVEVDTKSALGIGLASVILSFLKYIHSICMVSSYNIVIELLFCLTMFGVWTAGVIILTYLPSGAFAAETATGFFATWLCLVFTGYYILSVWGGIAMSESGVSKPNKEPRKNAAGKEVNEELYDIEPNKGSRRILAYKKGVTPMTAILIILQIGVVASASIVVAGEGRQGKAIFAIILAASSLIILFTSLFLTIGDFGDPGNYFVIMSSLVMLQMGIISFTTLSEPFAPRSLDEETQVLVYNLVGNGFFAAMGSFLCSVYILYKSHLMILVINDLNGKRGIAYGVYGRHIWLFLLFFSSIVVLVASAIECDSFSGCQNNKFLGPTLGMSFFSAFFCVVSFLICKNNADLGDIRYLYEDDDKLYKENKTTEQKIEIIIAIVLILIWITAVLTFTFAVESPFATSSAGFFFIWLSFIFSASYMDAVLPQLGLCTGKFMSLNLPNNMDSKANFGLVIILLGLVSQAVAVGATCIQNRGCEVEDFAAFGVQVFCFLILVLLLINRPQTLGYVAILFVYLLVIGAYILLFTTTVIIGPFVDVQGNGFFSAWIVVYGAVYLTTQYEWYLP